MPTDRRDPLLPIKIAAHRALRYARWRWERERYARRRPAALATAVLAETRSRLVRDPARARIEMAEGQRRNLEIGAPGAPRAGLVSAVDVGIYTLGSDLHGAAIRRALAARGARGLRRRLCRTCLSRSPVSLRRQPSLVPA